MSTIRRGHYFEFKRGEWVKDGDNNALIDAADKHSDNYAGQDIPARDVRASINNAFFAGAKFAATNGVKVCRWTNKPCPHHCDESPDDCKRDGPMAEIERITAGVRPVDGLAEWLRRMADHFIAEGGFQGGVEVAEMLRWADALGVQPVHAPSTDERKAFAEWWLRTRGFRASKLGQEYATNEEVGAWDAWQARATIGVAATAKTADGGM